LQLLGRNDVLLQDLVTGYDTDRDRNFLDVFRSPFRRHHDLFGLFVLIRWSLRALSLGSLRPHNRSQR
jgi:hypothetical protein